MKGLITIFVIFTIFGSFASFIFFMTSDPNAPEKLENFYANNNFSYLTSTPMLLSLAVAFYLFHKKRIAKISKAWERFANENGLTYVKFKSFTEGMTNKDAPGLYGDVKGKVQATNGSDINLIRKLVTTTSGTSKNRQSSTNTVLYLESKLLPKDLYIGPDFSIPLGFLNKLVNKVRSKLGRENFETQNLEFNERYDVSFLNGKDFSTLLTSELCKQFTELPIRKNCSFSIHGGKLVYTFYKTPTECEQLSDVLREGQRIIGLFPKA